MQKFIRYMLAALLVAATMPTISAAAPRYSHRDRERFVSSYCQRHPGERDCRDWRRNHNHWNDARYRRWYRDHRYRFGPADAAAAIFGFAAGAIAGAASGAAHGATNGAHVAACRAHYRTYDPRTDMYMGYDGHHHYCRL